MYIVFEGCDGCGKTSVSKKVCQILNELKFPTEWHGHPGATPYGTKIREIVKYSDIEISPFSEQILMATDYYEFNNSKLVPALLRGMNVISDRFNPISAYAYGTSNGASESDIIAINDILWGRVDRIDMLFVFNVDFDTIKSRMSKDEGDRLKCRIEKRGDEFFKKVVDAYGKICDRNSDVFANIELRFLESGDALNIIDATESFDKVVENVLSLIIKEITRRSK